MSQRITLDEKRKKLFAFNKKKTKLDNDIKALKNEILLGEEACNHQWEAPKYDKEAKTMVRICEFCGKISKPRTIDFR